MDKAAAPENQALSQSERARRGRWLWLGLPTTVLCAAALWIWLRPAPAPAPVARPPGLATVVLAARPVNLDGRREIGPAQPVVLGDPSGPRAWAAQPDNRWPSGAPGRTQPLLYIGTQPAMPFLEARLELHGIARDEVTVAWETRLTYARTVAGRTLQTDSGVLRDSDEDGDGVWNISAAWPGPGFFGGEGALRWTVRDLAGTVLGAGSIPYAVRGENPGRADIRAALAEPGNLDAPLPGLPDAPDTLRKAMDAVIAHESFGRQFNADPARGPSPFPAPPEASPGHGKPRKTLDDYPQHNPNHSSDGLGVGLTQVSWGDFDAALLADAAWNWRGNLHAGCRVLAAKALSAAAAMRRERRWAELDCGAPVPVPRVVLAGLAIGDDPARRDLSPELATALKFYNGATSPRTDQVPAGQLMGRMDTQSRPAFRWDSRRHKWVAAFHTAAPAGKRTADGDDAMRANAYLEKVLAEWPR